MRTTTFFACMSLMLSSTVLAAPTTQPINEPVSQTSAPAATQPFVAESGSLLIVPFAESAGVSTPWLGRAIQQDLLADLSRTTRARVDAPASMRPAVDASVALDAGRRAGAALVLYGQYQVIGSQVRITGQVLDSNTGKSGGGFSATGPMNNLFPMEDSVLNQVLRELPPGWLIVSLPAVQQQSPVAPGAYAAPSVPVQPAAQSPQYYSYTYPDYVGPRQAPTYYYGPYPYDWYDVPYYGPDIWFYGGWDVYHRHYWNGGGYGYHGHEFEHGIPHGFGHSPSAHGEFGGGFHGGGGGFHGRR